MTGELSLHSESGIIQEINKCRSGVLSTPRRGDWYKQSRIGLYKQASVTATRLEALMFYVYGLYLEGDDEVRYVGSTCNPRSRLWGHGRGDGSNPAKDEWAVPNRAKLRMKIFYSDVPEKDRRRIEQRTINECKKKGYRLFNHRGATEYAATAQDVTWWLDQLGDNEVK